ncbi:hypothetical protein AX016_3429 [Cellulophaga sp. RHA19]|uniref:DUF5723 family protein n=1 Tax=Cellulophaga sp. RHA19 TaxID=1798237 RepID=UPI000C2C2E0E|nr:DUF5723 family protein [Cellulophaga sp. RHA19]PKB45191.1 hypothetical protein AX016_3429 [Cellulophaga sp. RHA19]
MINRYVMLLFFACTFYGFAQNKQIMYDFKEVPQAMLLNPGIETGLNMYVGVPLLSGISFQAGSSGASVNDFFANDGLDINDKIRERALYGMKPTDDLSGTYQVEILNVGFRSKKNPDNFYSFGIYNEGDAIGYWFKDYAILGFEGNADRLNQRFDLSHLKTRGEMVNVFHFGINKRIDNRLIVGVRGKLYSSIFSFKSTKNKGYFVTTPGENNLLASTLVADMQLQTSGLNSIKDANDDGTGVGSVLTKRGLLGGDLGVGVDLGFTYQLNRNTTVTASILDLGFIMHSTDVRNYTLKGQATVEGVEVILPEDLIGTGRDFWQELVDEVDGLIPYEENQDSYISFRPTKLYGSIRYNFGEQNRSMQDCDCKAGGSRGSLGYPNAVGGQLYVINRPRGPQVAVTGFYQRNFGKTLSLKTTYTIDKYSATNIGFGANLNLGPVNLYAMADNLVGYKNLAASQYASFQLGINVISWR